MIVKNGYILYGGYGPMRGINPSGVDVNLRLSAKINEGVGAITFVSGSPWVVTPAWDPQGTNGTYVFIRPWGSMSTIAVSASAVYASVAVVGSDFVIAYNSEVGKLTVVTVPIKSTKSVIP